MPEYRPITVDDALKKLANPITDIPDRGNEIATIYTVGQGDSVFSIATEYKLEPKSVLWANQATLQDDPQMISVGLTLNVPPVDGVLLPVEGRGHAGSRCRKIWESPLKIS